MTRVHCPAAPRVHPRMRRDRHLLPGRWWSVSAYLPAPPDPSRSQVTGSEVINGEAPPNVQIDRVSPDQRLVCPESGGSEDTALCRLVDDSTLPTFWARREGCMTWERT